MESPARSRDVTEQALLQIMLPDGLYLLPRDLNEPKPLEPGSAGEQLTTQLILAVGVLIIGMIMLFL